MVPVFALLRVGLFFFYSRTSVDLGGRTSPGRFGPYVKIVAAVLLAVALFLPLYSVGEWKNGRPSMDEPRRYGDARQLVAEDWGAAIPLAFALLWPVPVLFLLRRWSGRPAEVVLHVLEPLLAAASTVVILWIPQMIFEFQLVLFVPVLAPVRPEIGCYVAVLANGLYFVGWLTEFLRPWVVGSAAAHA